MVEAFIQFPFLQRALAVSVLVGLLCGVTGVFLVFNRMSFFADAIAHSALAGIAIGLLLGVAPFWSAMVFALVIALLSIFLKNQGRFNIDTILGLFLPFSMALGVLFLGLKRSYTPDLLSYLFGNILAVSSTDLWVIGGLLLISMIWILKNYRNLIMIVFDREMALANGVRVVGIEYIFIALMSMIVVASVQVIGIVLVGGLLVIPAAAAKNLAGSFKQLLFLAGLIGLVSGVLGLFLSYSLNIASGSAIVVVAVGIFVLTLIYKRN